jgi:putative oxidoreductase
MSMTLLAPIGRLLFAAIYIISIATHMQPASIAYAKQVGLPAAAFLVPASGILAGLGGLSVALGYHARVGAALIALFLIPVTLTMHNFWAVKDPMMAQMQMAMFMKNLSMLGGALLISQFGAGPLSLDARRDSGRE